MPKFDNFLKMMVSHIWELIDIKWYGQNYELSDFKKCKFIRVAFKNNFKKTPNGGEISQPLETLPPCKL